MSYCHLFNRCAGWLLLLSCQVDLGNLSEKEFEDLILNWNKINILADLKIDEFLKMAHVGIGSEDDWKLTNTETCEKLGHA
jgi:hypothetical protein